MKQDEYDLLLGKPQKIHPKRQKYIQEKWCRKGWVGEKLDRIKDLAINKDKYVSKWDGRVVIVDFIAESWYWHQSIGVLRDCGDNGFYFYTNPLNVYFIGYYGHLDGIAYADLHPNPRKIWRKINYFHWKYEKIENRFHKKITTMCPSTTCNYAKAITEGIFEYSNPYGKIGECFPDCQCKFLEQ